MALEPSLKRAVRRIADAVREFAQAQGWSPDEYRIYVRDNWDWGRIHLYIASRAFRGPNDHEDYERVRAHLEHALADEPGLADAIGLVVAPIDIDEAGRDGLPGLGSGYAEIDDYLISGPPVSGSSPLSGSPPRGW